jgi:lipoyl-dependent peroxiredoxin
MRGVAKRGGGTVTVGSGALESPYSFRSRFEEGDGTNPEELIAAAHAGCFTMALSLILGDAGHEPDSIETDASVRIRPAGDGFEIDRIQLRTTARVSGVDAEELRRHAEAAKDNCPVSKALGGVGEITLEAELAG